MYMDSEMYTKVIFNSGHYQNQITNVLLIKNAFDNVVWRNISTRDSIRLMLETTFWFSSSAFDHSLIDYWL